MAGRRATGASRSVRGRVIVRSHPQRGGKKIAGQKPREYEGEVTVRVARRKRNK